MIFYFLITCSVIFLAWYVNNAPNQNHTVLSLGRMPRQELINKICLVSIFMILFLTAALRHQTGNDYYTYVNRFHELWVDGYTEFEFGNKILIKLLYTLCGFECYELVFAVFAAVTVYFFIRVLYEQTTDFFMAFSLFMLLGMYFQSYNTVRYYMALSMAVFSIRYVLRKQYLRFVLIIAVAACFHKSVLLCIPLYFLASFKWKKWMIGVGMGLATTGYWFGDFYQKILLVLYPSYKDTVWLEAGTSYIQLARCLLILGIGLVFYKKAVKDDQAMLLYFQLNLVAIALYMFGSFVPVISRIGYYMTFPHILFLTTLIVKLKEEAYYKKLRILIMVAAVLYFLVFLWQCDADFMKLLPYRSMLMEHDRIEFNYPMLYMNE